MELALDDPAHAFGLNDSVTHAAVATDRNALACVLTVGCRLSLARPQDRLDPGAAALSMEFVQHSKGVRRVNGVFVDARRRYLCVCTSDLRRTGASDRIAHAAVYSLMAHKDGMPKKLKSLQFSCEPDPGGDGDGAAAPSSDSGAPSTAASGAPGAGGACDFVAAAFSADAQFLVCVTAAPDAIAVGFEWQRQGQNGRKIFTTRLGLDTSAISYQPSESTSMATSGPQHLQLWRLSNHQLKQSPIKYLTLDEGTCYTAHAWTDDMRLVATTTSGHVVVVDDNEQAQLIRGAHDPLSGGDEKGTGKGPAINSVAAFGSGFVTAGAGGSVCIFDLPPSGDKTALVAKPAFVRLRCVRCGAGADGEPAPEILSLSLFPIVSGVALQEGTGEKGKGKGAAAAAAAAGLVGGGAGSGAHMSNLALLRRRGGLALLDLSSLPRPSGKKLIDVPLTPYGMAYHTGAIGAGGLSAAARKPLLASCSSSDGDASVRLWNWHTRAVVVTHVFEGLQRPIAVALHPSGNVLLVGFEEQIRLYHVCEDNLLLAFEIPVKGVVTLRDGESILVANPLSTVAFAHGGHFFAAVTGRLVQVFALYESSKGGKPGLIHILRGHAASVTALSWSRDDRTLWTSSDDGALYEWSIGERKARGRIVSRVRDCVRLGVLLTAVAVGGDGMLVAAGTLKATTKRAGSRPGTSASSGAAGGARKGAKGGTMGGRSTMFNAKEKGGAAAKASTGGATGGGAAGGATGGGSEGGTMYMDVDDPLSLSTSLCTWRDGAIDDQQALDDYAVGGHGVCSLLAIAPEGGEDKAGALPAPRALTGGSISGSLLLYDWPPKHTEKKALRTSPSGSL